jgi:dTDP-4-dehydrorhamnose 3,5-epimerase
LLILKVFIEIKSRIEITGVFKMAFKETGLPGLLVYQPRVFEDSRGYFFESYNEKVFADVGIAVSFVQDNESSSSFGVIRGLHYQLNPHAQAKLIRVVEGSVLDVAVDIRKNSPTYGKHFSIELSDKNRTQLYLPTGFAHGFSVLSKRAIVIYKCDGFYNRESEGGIRFDDPALGIDWGIPTVEAVISDKDKELPLFANCKNNFEYKE